MDDRVLEIVLKAKDEASKVISDVGNSVDKLSGQFQSAGKQIQGVGTSLTKNVTVPLVAVGGAALLASNQVENAMQTIIEGTGATGKELTELQGILETVAGTSIQSFDEVAVVIKQYRSQLDLTGKSLEENSKLFLQFAKVTNVDVATSIKDITRLYAALNINSEDYAIILEQLTLASQKTGTSVDQLINSVATVGPTLQELGLGVTEQIALFAQLSKAGIEPQAIMMGLRSTLIRLSKEGFTDGEEALTEYIRRIKEAPDNITAVGIAQEVFGRGAVQMSKAIRDGTVDISGLTKELANASGTIQQADDNATTFGENMAELRNQATLALAPLGAVLVDVFTEALPTIKQGVGLIQRMADSFKELPDPVRKGIVAIGMIAAVLGPVLFIIGTLVSAVGSVIGAITGLIGVFSAIAGVITGVVVPAIGAIVAVLGGPITIAIVAIIALIGLLALAWKNNWFGIQEKVAAVVDWFTGTVVPAIQAFVDNLILFFTNLWTQIVTLAQPVIDFFNAVFMPLFQAVFGLLSTLIQLFVGLWMLQFQIMISVAQMVIDFLVAVFGPTFTTIFNFIGDLIAFWVEGIKLQFAILTKIIQTLMDFLDKNFKPIVNNVFNAIKIIISGLVDHWIGNFNKVKDAIQGVINTLTNLINKSREAANAVGKGLGVPGFQFGGFVPETGLALLHKGEYVVSNDMQRGRTGQQSTVSTSNTFNQPINIQVNSMAGDSDFDAMSYRLQWILRNSR